MSSDTANNRAPLSKTSNKSPHRSIPKTSANLDSRLHEQIERCIQTHFTDCQSRIPHFTRQHFRYPGCWQTNRHAIGLDLLRAPLNLIWAPIYVLLQVVLLLLRLSGLSRAGQWATQLPGGLTTQVQKHINQLIRTDLLNVKSLQHSISHKLFEELQSELHCAPTTPPSSTHTPQEVLALEHKIEMIVSDALEQLMLARTASADISNTLFSTFLGAVAFKKFTPGSIGIGFLLATYWASTQAKKNFFLGEHIGHIYYSIVPPSPSLYTISIGIFMVMLILAVIASLSGLLTDPLQTHLRLHQRRLRKMLKQLEHDMIRNSRGSFRPLDPYIARILELLDALKVQWIL